jgi:hypothetical protein
VGWEQFPPGRWQAEVPAWSTNRNDSAELQG